MLKTKERELKNLLINKLNDIEQNNAADYWSIIQELEAIYKDRADKSDQIDPSIWEAHFKTLMQKDISDSETVRKVKEYLANEENWKIFNELSFKITETELRKAARNLKSNKSAGTDLIINEMLKSSIDVMYPTLLKLFDLLLRHSYIPEEWGLSLLKPLHKGGSTQDPNCFRGISLMSCIGKLFLSILNNRLTSFMSDRNLNTRYQIAFEPKKRTSDHILTLKTITDKYTQNGQKVYSCLVDFRKAFDTVWREGLIYKLLKYDIGGPFGKIIKSLYDNTHVSIKLSGGITPSFKTTIGVRQGCVLSPTLFKIFINDLPDIFTEYCKPVSLGNDNLNCLMFADDLVLLSETPEGLQSALDKLQDYCDKWFLQINTKKTKIIIFNKAGRLVTKNTFTINDEEIEIVNRHPYLGITIACSGTFSYAVDLLCKKAMKAIFKIRNITSMSSLTIKKTLHLFDTLVRPIMTYGCEAWGVFTYNLDIFDDEKDNFHKLDRVVLEKMDLRFCKYALGTHRKSSNVATRGELGRFPIAMFIMKQVLKNWLRISRQDIHPLMQDVYVENIRLCHEGKKCWLGRVKELIVDRIGMPEIWNNQGGTGQGLIKKMMDTLKLRFTKIWNDKLNRTSGNDNQNGGKLRTYRHMKKHFVFENYLINMKNNKARKNLTRLRISSHNLGIEKGRHAGKNVTERICMTCNNGSIDDEFHTILKCKSYDEPRSELMTDLKTAVSAFEQFNENEKFNIIMSCKVGDDDLSGQVEKYILELVRIRKNEF